MTVQELIDQLNEQEDKSLPVMLAIESGRGCNSIGSVEEVLFQDGSEDGCEEFTQGDCVILGGVEVYSC